MTECFTPIRGRKVRVTELDECGNVDLDGQFVVSEGFITVTLSFENESGDEYIQKNAAGKLCVNERNPDALKRLNAEVDWCQVDPDMVSLITGFPVELSELDAVGFRIKEGEYETRWGLEVWTDLAGNVCDEAGNRCYGYLLIPLITGAAISGDITVENSNLTFQTMGYTEGNSGWGVGPWDVIGTPAGPLDEAMAADEHALIRTTCVAPPAAVCGAQEIPGSASV